MTTKKSMNRAAYIILLICVPLILFLTLAKPSFDTEIDTAAKYPLNEIQKNAIHAIAKNEIKGIISENPTVFTYTDLGVKELVSARKLSIAYDENEVAADNVYKGKVLAVKGTIREISKDFTGSPILQLTGHNMFMNVQAYMEESELSNMTGMQKGDSVFLVCRGDGVVIGSPILKECQNTFSYLEQRALSEVNTFLKGKTPDNRRVATMVSFGLYTALNLSNESPCNMDSSEACVQDVEETFKKISPPGPDNRDFMSIIDGLNKAGCLSDESVAKLRNATAKNQS